MPPEVGFAQDERCSPRTVIMESPAVMQEAAVAFSDSTPAMRCIPENGNEKSEGAKEQSMVAEKGDQSCQETKKYGKSQISPSSSSFLSSLSHRSTSEIETPAAVISEAQADDKDLNDTIRFLRSCTSATADDISAQVIRGESEKYEAFQKEVESWGGKLPEFPQSDANAANASKSNDDNSNSFFQQQQPCNQQNINKNNNNNNRTNPVGIAVPPNLVDVFQDLQDQHNQEDAADDILDDLRVASNRAYRIVTRYNRDRSAAVRRLHTQTTSATTSLLVERWFRSHLKCQESVQRVMEAASATHKKMVPFIFSDDATTVVEKHQQKLATFFLQERSSIRRPNDHNQRNATSHYSGLFD